jgi:SAM-dependent methyltransferase
LVVCAFASVVEHATGIDLTPAMIGRAQALQRERAIGNVTWRVGDVLPLPFPSASFSIVSSRFAFHHFLDPGAVLAEMCRVCAPGGRIVVADVTASPDAATAAAFNRREKLRDPSHVRALTLAELGALFRACALGPVRTRFYHLASDVEGLLERSFPAPGDAEVIRRMFVDALADDDFGLRVRRAGDAIDSRIGGDPRRRRRRRRRLTSSSIPACIHRVVRRGARVLGGARGTARPPTSRMLRRFEAAL